MKYMHLSLLLAWVLSAQAALEIEPPPAQDPGAPAAGAPSVAAMDAGGKGVVTLKNTDRISGRVIHLDFDEQVLMLQHDHVREPLAIRIDALNTFSAERIESTPSRPSDWTVQLGNGDRLRGNIKSVNDTSIHLDTWYAGPLHIDRTMVSGMMQYQTARTLYTGPHTEDGWATHGTHRFLGDSIMMSMNGAIGRELPRYSPKIRIDIDAEWMWQAQFSIRLFAEQSIDQSNSSSAYMLTLSGNNRVSLLRITGGRGSRTIDQSNLGAIPNENQRYTFSMSLFADAATGRFYMYQDNRQVGEWTDTQALDTQGRHFSIVCSHAQQLEFRTIRVSEWDGRLPSDVPSRPSDGKQHAFRMQNGDSVSGLLRGIENAVAQVETSFGSLNIPIERIDHVRFNDEADVAQQHAGDVRLNLLDETILTLDVRQLKEGYIHGQSANFGDVRIPLSGVRGMEWHIHDADKPQPKPEQAEPAGDIPVHIIHRGGFGF